MEQASGLPPPVWRQASGRRDGVKQRRSGDLSLYLTGPAPFHLEERGVLPVMLIVQAKWMCSALQSAGCECCFTDGEAAVEVEYRGLMDPQERRRIGRHFER